jgi:catechol 2,3-dioxygenase-like lactoylglutathione lyase family enzyme
VAAWDFIIEEYSVGRTGACSAERAKPAYSNRLEVCMPNFDNLKKQAKLLVRWHREGNHSVGGRIRMLPRYRNLTDVEVLELKFPLSEAQEIIALEAGHANWAALKAGLSMVPAQGHAVDRPSPVLKGAFPVLFVANVEATAAFFRDRLGFAIDFLHGNPPFYGSVCRGAARLHLRFVHEPVFASGAREREDGLLSAFIEVDNVKDLFAEYKTAGVEFAQPLRKEPWGASAFIVLDPDENYLCFAG